jgi:hypothetical protein
MGIAGFLQSVFKATDRGKEFVSPNLLGKARIILSTVIFIKLS